MAKLIIVENDVVSNSEDDKHSVYGETKSSPPIDVSQIFNYDFSGNVEEKEEGNDFVKISNKLIVTKGNNQCPQIDKHSPENDVAGGVKNWMETNKLSGFGFPGIADEPDNNGENSSDAGSSFVFINGAAIILDGDSFDTCHAVGSSNKGRNKNSTVTSSRQDFVRISE